MLAERVAAQRGPLLRLAGVLLLVLGVVLAVAGERDLEGYRVALAQHGGAVDDQSHALEPQAGLQGQVVRVVGTPRVVVSPYDPDFNQQSATPVLTRHVQMFQWRELRLGNSTTYELDWVNAPVDSSRFAQPNGHANPGPFPLAGKQFQSERVQLGGYTLGDALVRALPGSEPVAPDMKTLPANFAATFSEHAHALVTSTTPGDPRLGDLRVSWSAVPLQEVTVLARVDGDRLVAVPNAVDGTGYAVNVGDSPLLDMRPDLAAQPALVWPRRILAVLLATLGAGLLLRRGAARIDALVALGGGLLATGVFAAIPWLGFSTRDVVAWLGAALVGVALLAWRRRVLNRR